MKGASSSRSTALAQLDKYGSIAAFALLIIAFSAISEHFRAGSNYMNIIVQAAPLMIIALGVNFINMAGESDLSLGGVIGVCASLFCGLIGKGASPLAAAAVAVAAGLAFAAVDGLMVAYAGLSSFIVTISIMFLSMGVEMTYSKGASLWIRDNPILVIVNGSILGVPNLVVIALALFAASYILMHKTKLGVHVQAVGQSTDAARYAGIPIKRLKFLMFLLGGLFYALGGMLNSLRSSGSIIYSGQKLLLPALAITFIGKTVLGSKKSNVPGILVGALMMSAINNAFTMLGVSFYFTTIVQGLVLLIAAGFSVGNRKTILQEDLR